MIFFKIAIKAKTIFLTIAVLLLLCSACSMHVIVDHGHRSKFKVRNYKVLDNNPAFWNTKNQQTRFYVNQYAAPSSSHVRLSLIRAEPYLPFILNELRKKNLPPQLAYLPILESGFNPQARSKTGAVGLWQFKEPTARQEGLRVSRLADDRKDWKKSTVAAVQYLEKLGKMHNYDWALALASYNGGKGYINRAIKAQRTTDFWRLNLKHETKTFVPKHLAIVEVVRTKYPEHYFSFH